MKFYLFFLGALLSAANLFAQTYSPKRIEMKAEVNPQGAVMLRWAPSNYELFERGYKYGYKLTRVPISLNGQPAPVGEILTPTVLKSSITPWPRYRWQHLMENDTSDWPVLGAGAIFGENFTVLDPDTADILQVASLNHEKENQFTFGLFAAEQSFEVAEAMGLGWRDTTAAPNAEYLYSIELKYPPVNVQPAKLQVSTNQIVTLPIPQLSAESGDLSVTLSWKRENLEDFYSSYLVERSVDGGATWNPINTKPLVFISENQQAAEAMFFKDSLAENGVSYQYRVAGVTAFGNLGPASNIAYVSGAPGPAGNIDLTISVVESAPGAMLVKWILPAEATANIAVIDVLRSAKINGDYAAVNLSPLSPTTTQFSDESPLSVNYYIVECTDVNGYPHRSIAMLGQPNDATPPEAVAAPVVHCDKKGKVKIHWAPTTSEDVMGYRVYMSNNNNLADMKQITTDWISDTAFVCQIDMNTLSEHIYFSVKAVDFRENNSPYSPPGVGARPDVIPPAPPVISNYTLPMNGVELNFIPSSSTDVVNYKLQRRLKGYIDWDVIATLGQVGIKPFLDTTVNKKRRYEYRLVALDEVNLEGISNILEVKPLDNGLRSPIENLLATKVGSAGVIPEPKSVLLSWDYPISDEPDLMGFQIMRAVGGDPMRTLEFISLTAAGNASNQGSPGGGNLPGDFAYFDLDAATFKKIIQQGKVQPANAVTPPLTTGALGVVVRYSVYATFVDGAMSPISTVTVIW